MPAHGLADYAWQNLWHIPTVFVSFLFLLAPPLAALELLNNIDFEGAYVNLPRSPDCPNIVGAIAVAWQDDSCWHKTSQINYARDGINPHHGIAAQRVTVNAGQVQLVYKIAWQSGQLYTTRLWLRAAQTMTVAILLRKSTLPYTEYIKREFQLTNRWTQYIVQGYTDTSEGYLMVQSTMPGTFWIDDASLESAAIPIRNPPTAVITRGLFGMHSRYPTIPSSYMGTVIGAVRVWDADQCQWSEIQTSPGVYHWQVLDERVDTAFVHHADVIMNLGRTPQWASVRPRETSAHGSGEAAEPAKLRYWREWVEAVGLRYRGKIKYWEIWNEANDPKFYSGTPETLLKLSRIAYQILKRIDPANLILTPSSYSPAYLDRYLGLGGGAVADIISYHFYPGMPAPGVNAGLGQDQEPEHAYRWYIPNILLILKRYQIDQKPLWNTEAGWLRPGYGGPRTLLGKLGAAYLARAYLLNWASGAERFYYYAWDDHAAMNVELLQNDNSTLSQAGLAYYEAARWLLGAQLMSLTETQEEGLWIAELRYPTGLRAYMLWHPHTLPAFQPPVSWNIRQLRDLRGNVMFLNSGQAIAVSASPVLLEENTNLLSNGDMETGTLAWRNHHCVVATVVTLAHRGSRSLKITRREAAWAGAQQPLGNRLIPGNYSTSVYMRTRAGTAQALITLKLATDMETTYLTMTPTITVTNSDWSFLEGKINVDWRGKLQAANWYIETRDDTGVYYLDDAILSYSP